MPFSIKNTLSSIRYNQAQGSLIEMMQVVKREIHVGYQQI